MLPAAFYCWKGLLDGSDYCCCCIGQHNGDEDEVTAAEVKGGFMANALFVGGYIYFIALMLFQGATAKLKGVKACGSSGFGANGDAVAT